MKHFEKIVPRNFNYFLFGDLHFGTRMQYPEGIKEMIDTMQSPYDGVKHNIGIDHGDVIEGIMIDDKRYDPDTVENYPMEQIKDYVAMVYPVRKKLVCVLDGNHPKRHWKFFGKEGATGEACERLDVPFGTWTAVITFVDRQGRYLFKHFATHGKKMIKSVADDPVRQKANMELSLKRILKKRFGDTILMSRGHTHKLMKLEPLSELYIADEGSRLLVPKHTAPRKTRGFIHPDHRWYISSGGFHALYKEGIDGYGEIAEYDPLELGFSIVRVRDGKIAGVDLIEVGV